MATTNITHIGTSQTVLDLKPLSTAENIVSYSSTASSIALLVTAATIAISPIVANISQGSITSLATANYSITVTLTDSGYVTGSSGQRILTGQASVSGQPSGQSMKWKLELANQTVKIHGVSLQWS